MRTGRRLVGALAALVLGTAGVGLGLWAGGPTGMDPPAARPQAPPAASDAGRTAVQETVTFRGQVLGPDGKPVPAARLFTYQPRAGSSSANAVLELAQRAVTGADGRFRFDAPKVSVYPSGDQASLLPVVAAADGFGTIWANVTRPGEDLTLRLAPDVPIVGRLLDAEGRPAAGATVRVREFTRERTGRLDRFLTGWQTQWMDALYADSEGGLNGPPASAVRVTGPDRDGRFRITGIGVESVALLDVDGPGLARAVLYVLTRPGFDPGPVNRATLERIPPSQRFPGQPPLLYGPSFDFVAQPAKPVEGTIREAGSGRPVAGARVSAAAAYNLSLDATTDAAGRFRITGMSKQEDYHVYVGPADGSPLIARTFQLPDTDGLQPVRADLELARGVVVTGRVIDRATGRGVHCSLGYVALPGNTFIRRPEFAVVADRSLASSTDEEGHFRFPVLPGPGVLMAQAHGRETLDGHEVNPYVGAKFDEEDRKLVPVLAGGAGEPVFATAGGKFESIAHESAVKRLDLAEGGEAVMVNVFVHRGRTATVRLQAPDGRPLTGVVVAGMTAMWPTTFTLPQAECTVYALDPVKPRTVVFYHAEQKLAGTLTVRGDEAGPLTARLGPTGAITGRVLDADGQPVVGATIRLLYWDESARELDRHLRQRTELPRADTAGRFRIDEVIPDMKFEPGFRKGSTALLLQPRGQSRRVGAGATLDLGDLRPQPMPP
jgi:protocatechuate 3,4-dioxygenase beta subunit